MERLRKHNIGRMESYRNWLPDCWHLCSFDGLNWLPVGFLVFNCTLNICILILINLFMLVYSQSPGLSELYLPLSIIVDKWKNLTV